MTAIYVGVRDGFAAAQVGAGVWKTQGTFQTPWYTRDDEPQMKTGEDLFRDFGHLVQRGDH